METKKIVALTLIDILVIFISLVLGNYWYQTYYAPESYVIGNVTVDEYKPYEDTTIQDYVSTEDILFSANINKARFSSVEGISTYEYNFEHIDFNGEENNYGIYVGNVLLSRLTETAGTISGTNIVKFYDVDKQVLCECSIQVAFSSYTNKTTMRVTLAEENLGYLMKHFEANDFIITLVKNPFEIGVDIGNFVENLSTLTIIDDGIETTFTKEIGTEYALPTPRLTDYSFLGWEITSGDGVLEGTILTFGESNTTIVAKYDICDMSFNVVGPDTYLYEDITWILGETNYVRKAKSCSLALSISGTTKNRVYLSNIKTDASRYTILNSGTSGITLTWFDATYFTCNVSSILSETAPESTSSSSIGSLNMNIRADAPSTIVADYSEEDNGVVATYTLDEFETESDVVNMVYHVNDTAINCELTAVQTYSSGSDKTWICAEVTEGPYTLRDIVLTNNSLSLVIDCDFEMMSNNYVLESALLYSLSAEDNEGIYPLVEPIKVYRMDFDTDTMQLNDNGMYSDYIDTSIDVVDSVSMHPSIAEGWTYFYNPTTSLLYVNVSGINIPSLVSGVQFTFGYKINGEFDSTFSTYSTWISIEAGTYCGWSEFYYEGKNCTDCSYVRLSIKDGFESFEIVYFKVVDDYEYLSPLYQNFKDVTISDGIATLTCVDGSTMTMFEYMPQTFYDTNRFYFMDYENFDVELANSLLEDGKIVYVISNNLSELGTLNCMYGKKEGSSSDYYHICWSTDLDEFYKTLYSYYPEKIDDTIELTDYAICIGLYSCSYMSFN